MKLTYILSAVAAIAVVAVVFLLFFNSPAHASASSTTQNSSSTSAFEGASAEITIENSSNISSVFSSHGGFPGGFNTTKGFEGNASRFGGMGAGGISGGAGFGLGSGTLSESLIGSISGLSGVYAVSPELFSSGYVDGEETTIYGIEPSTYSEVFNSSLDIIAGSNLNSSEGDYIVIGEALAKELGVSVGSQVAVSTSSAGSTGSLYTIVGIYNESIGAFRSFTSGSSGASDLISLLEPVYVSLSNAQAILNESGKVSTIGVKCMSPSDISTVAIEINTTIKHISVVTATSTFKLPMFNQTLINGTRFPGNYSMNGTFP